MDLSAEEIEFSIKCFRNLKRKNQRYTLAEIATLLNLQTKKSIYKTPFKKLLALSAFEFDGYNDENREKNYYFNKMVLANILLDIIAKEVEISIPLIWKSRL